ncbi:transposase [Persicitalea sp.]|uniref:helix-turn-helix domain-containing protein n=1 Tax=Persicitalea sp. TaxID=3100273 RepID=UPI003592FF2D
MGRTLTIELTAEQLFELRHNYRTGESHAFRQRCRMVVLKSQGLKTRDICELVEIRSQNQVNGWIKRYKEGYAGQGINVLYNAPGQGRKSTFDAVTDAERVRQVVSSERQKLANAKAILEKQMGKEFHLKTLHNFLKALVGTPN